MEFFEAERISPSTTKITILNNVFCYLVEGEKQAALIDTGMGVGDLKAFVETLTDKPIIVILTHGHVDHAGGAAAFENVYLHEKDLGLIKIHDTIERKWLYVSRVMRNKLDGLSREELCPERKDGYLPLKDGQHFKLGGVTLEIIHVCGHTQGSVCILNQQERWMVFGDSCSPSVFLWSEESTNVETYLKSLMRLKSYEKCYDTVYLSHGATTIDKCILDGVIELCKEIMEGKDDGIPYPFLDFEGLKKAKETGFSFMRKDGGLGNIIYREEKRA